MGIFSLPKKSPEAKIKVSKVKEQRSLVTSFAIGAVITGGLYALPAAATNRFNFWEAAAVAAAGALACVTCKAVQNQPGSAEAIRTLVAANDEVLGTSAELQELLQAHSNKLDRHEGLHAEAIQRQSRLLGGLTGTAREIQQFREGLVNMAAASPHYQQPVPAQDFSQEYSHPEAVNTQGVRLEFEEEPPASDARSTTFSSGIEEMQVNPWET